jgi:hypothetical protein
MSEALEWVKRCPSPHPEDCEIEVRPVFEAADFGEALRRSADCARSASPVEPEPGGR